jgi:predicted small secreted protein
MKRLILIVALVLLAAVLVGCAPGPNTAAAEGADAGFWQGLWHGFIAGVTFVISLFNPNVSIYEINNNGGWYNFGYLLGLMSFWGGGGGGAAAGSRRR